MKIDIPGVDFAGLARQAIAERLTEAMVGADDLVRKIVLAALESKVDDRGNKSNYSSDNKWSYVEWVAQDMVRRATREVLAAKVAALQPAIEREVEAALRKSIKATARALTESFIERAKSGYGVNVHVTAGFENKER